MRKHSVFDRHRLVAATATVAAHANANDEGFRQKDVRFLMELFCNWIDPGSQRGPVLIQNTQVLRYLKELEEDGYIRCIQSRRKPLYRLTRSGLIELISSAISGDGLETPEHFLFLYYFISSYRPKVFELVKSEGRQFPYALELELQGLLDGKELVSREIKRTERRLRELDTRIIDAQKAAQLTADLTKRKVPDEEIVREWERLYPYALNSHKPLTELFAEIAPDIARWEFETGNIRRVETIWIPQRAMLSAYLETLRKMR